MDKIQKFELVVITIEHLKTFHKQ